ncbi:MAG: MiaB/RimO family radical SAM methylthiotransferase [Rickettsiales bacterium]|jgi:threonylcarbamoyladenosine tRNA methylthiotransferase MtaB|nr:MiaB/RimO family radical SAM methylthiotransferase [Rickettsiales bacterium]
MPVIVKSFGCRLNALEAAKIEIVASRAGLTDALIFNTCAVTGEAEAQARQAIRKAARENPGARIFVVGCGADRNPDGFAKLPNVAAVIKNADKFTPESYNPTPPLRGSRQGEAEPVGGQNITIEKCGQFSKGFVQIQTGCNYACTYCIVHTLRGPARSFDYDAILAQTKQLTSSGYSEITLTGVDIASYKFPSPVMVGQGPDHPGHKSRDSGLLSLIQKLLTDDPDIQRLRLSSLDPAHDWSDLIKLMKENPRLMPHLHLSMQSGSDEILRLMARRHRIADILKLPPCGKVGGFAAGGGSITFSVDIITGFPGETDELFQETLATLEKLRPIRIHAFPFSPRPGTPAATFPNQVPKSVAKDRVRELNALGTKFLNEFMVSQLGRPTQVLMERGGVGRTPNDIEFLFDAPEGAILTLTPTEIKDAKFKA